MKWFPVFDSRSACSYMPPRAESAFRWMMSLSMNKMNGALNLSDHFPYFFFVFLSVSLILSGVCSPVFFVVNCDTLIRRKIVKGRELGQVSETDVRFAVPQQGKWQVNWKRGKRKEREEPTVDFKGCAHKHPNSFRRQGQKLPQFKYLCHWKPRAIHLI